MVTGAIRGHSCTPCVAIATWKVESSMYLKLKWSGVDSRNFPLALLHASDPYLPYAVLGIGMLQFILLGRLRMSSQILM